jgi:O-antigen ligase
LVIINNLFNFKALYLIGGFFIFSNMALPFKNFYFESILILSYLSICFVFPFGSIDKAITQWLFLSLINLISIFYVLFKYTVYKEFINKIFKSYSFLFFSSFIFLSLFSIFYAYNTSEVLIKFSQWFNLFLAFFVSAFLIHKQGHLFFFKSLVFILVIQLYFTFDGYFKIINLVNYDFSYAFLLKGVTGNKNITSTLFLIQMPVVLYLFIIERKILLKLLYSFILFSIFYAVFIIGSRTSLLSISIVFILFVLFLVYHTVKGQLSSNKAFVISLHFIAPLLISYSIFTFSTVNKGSISVSERVSTINNSDVSVTSRLRFYNEAFTELLANPVLGIGAGNWKIRSIALDKKNIQNYTAPYHVHNDFLEIGVELGFLGLTCYLLFIGSLFYILYRLISKEIILINKLFLFILFLCLVIYFTDAFFNFPHARPVIGVLFSIISSVIVVEHIKVYKS